MSLFHNPMRIAFFLGIIPVLVIHVNYLIAASEGHVPWCMPYWDSCTSISATGRHGTAFYFFKATMLPMAFVYLAYWRLVSRALQEAGYRGRAIVVLGLICAAALVGYTITLGLVGNSFQYIRRVGIILFFCFTYLNQLLVVQQIYSLGLPDPTRQLQLGLTRLIIGIGLLTLFLDMSIANYDDYEDAFEWVIALLLHVNFLVAGFGWRSLRGAHVHVTQHN